MFPFACACTDLHSSILQVEQNRLLQFISGHIRRRTKSGSHILQGYSSDESVVQDEFYLGRVVLLYILHLAIHPPLIALCIGHNNRVPDPKEAAPLFGWTTVPHCAMDSVSGPHILGLSLDATTDEKRYQCRDFHY